MAERPKVEIIFKQLASTLVERSGEFPVVLLMTRYDGTEGVSNKLSSMWKELNYLSDISVDDLSGKTLNPENAYNSLRFCFANGPKKVIVSNYKWAETWERLKSKDITNCVVAKIDSNADNTTDLAIDITATANNESCGCCFVTRNGSVEKPILNDIHYMEIGGYVEYYDTDGNELSDYDINALYAGAIAACGVDRSLTNYTLPLISSIKLGTKAIGVDFTQRGFLSAEMTAGKPRVVAGINTAEVSDEVTEDMQQIEVVQTMDTVRKDITDTFVNYYRGAYKNNYDRQLLLIAAINGYFNNLAEEEVLDPEFENICEIDVEKQRQAWLDYGKSDAEDWSDDKVKQMSFGRRVILKANMKVCQSMGDLYMYITLE